MTTDTPRTDAKAQFFGFNPDEGEEFVTASFCRELERENAALRADLLMEEERSIYWRDNENRAMAENATLRDALEAQMKYQRDLRADRDRLDWVLTPIGSAVVYGHIRDNLLLTRDNIDRAMGVKP